MKKLLLLLPFLCLVMTIAAQEVPTYSKDAFEEATNTLDDKQLMKLLTAATEKQHAENPKKALKKAMKKLSAAEQAELLQMAQMNAEQNKRRAIKAAPKPAPAPPMGPITSIEFDTPTFEFGMIEQGEKVNYKFKFTNTGSEPFIISNAKGSCGCTVPEWPREPIAPGGQGEVSVTFNSKGKKGKRNQKVTITGNTDPAQTFIYLKGEVFVPEAPENAPKN